MDSFELNKIMGAVLGTLLFVMGAGLVAETIYHPIEDNGPGYALPEPEPTHGGEQAEAEPEVPLGVLLASADVSKGANSVKKCQSCHNFGEGEPNKQGPALYDVVGRVEAGVDGFAYSDILIAHREEGRVWDYENLNAFLTKPSDYAPGTKMNFAGIRTPEERANILAYLQTLSSSPVAFPEAVEIIEDAGTEAEAVPEVEQAVDAAVETDTPATTGTESVVETPETTSTETPVEGTPAATVN